jgi:hypothetical protein
MEKIMDQVREKAREQMIATIGKTKWDENMEFIKLLNTKIANHSINQHPIVKALDQSQFSLEELQTIHMEYREIVHIFTDALLMAQFQALKLDKTMKPGTKAYARFLITLNILDEFGFGYEIGKSTNGFEGSPENSHIILFENLMTQLEITDEDRAEYVGSSVTTDLKNFFLNSYHDLHLLIAFLALAEEIVMIFSPVMRKNAETLGVPVNQGYYNVHGSSDDEINEGSDDFHQNDLWLILAQILGDYDQSALLKECETFMDKWVVFWTQDFSSKRVKSSQIVERAVA